MTLRPKLQSSLYANNKKPPTKILDLRKIKKNPPKVISKNSIQNSMNISKISEESENPENSTTTRLQSHQGVNHFWIHLFEEAKQSQSLGEHKAAR